LSLEAKGSGIGQGSGKPSYISSSTFALVLVDIIASQHASTQVARNAEDVRIALAGSGYNQLAKLLLSVIGYTTADLQQAQQNLAQWFDEYMLRVDGWYKRKVQVIVLILSMLLAVILNADTLALADALSSNSALRSEVAKAVTAQVIAMPKTQAAEEDVASETVGEQIQNLDGGLTQIVTLWEQLDQLNLPLGWIVADPEREDPREIPSDPEGLVEKGLGLLITGLLVSLGAPFWFDLLSRLVNIRATGGEPESRVNGSATTILPWPYGGGLLSPIARPATEEPNPQPPSQISTEVQLAQLATESVDYVRQLKAVGQLRLPEAEVAAAWLVTKIHELGLGGKITVTQIEDALREAFA
jgi:hypothetical protein